MSYAKQPNSNLKAIEALPKLTDADLSYLAGLFDGEGSAGVYMTPSRKSKNGTWYKYPKPVLQIKMTDRDPIHFFTLCFPGSCRIEHTPDQKKRNYKAAWKFHAVCNNAKYVAKRLLPYVKNLSKVAQLEKVLQA